MKKVKIQIQKNVTCKTFLLFPSPEALYVWLSDMGPLGAIENLDRVVLNSQAEFIEAEWCGCEFVHGTSSSVCLNYVRMVKAAPSQNASGHVVSVHYGWCTSDMLPFDNGIISDVMVTKLGLADKQFDLSAIFKDV